MKQYHDCLRYVLENGVDRTDRTGIGTKSVFGYQMRFNFEDGFPAVTTKRLAWKGVVSELLWFMEGSTDERRLAEIRYGKPREELIGKRTIWTDNADHQGRLLGHTNTDQYKQLGPVYGKQWRDFNGVDQLQQVIQQLQETPDSRRIILSAWNPSELDQMALPPCHSFIQFYVQDGKLSGQLYQRSVDLFLGCPFNIASYALLIKILSSICNLKSHEFVWTGGDVHIYSTHINAVREQLEREPRQLPKLNMPTYHTLEDYLQCGVDDFVLENYNPMGKIQAPMAI